MSHASEDGDPCRCVRPIRGLTIDPKTGLQSLLGWWMAAFLGSTANLILPFHLPRSRRRGDPSMYRWRQAAIHVGQLAAVASLSWVSTPRWSAALTTVPVSTTTVVVPELQPGPSTVQRVMDPFSAQGRASLSPSNEDGTIDQTWRCLADAGSGEAAYGTLPRRSVVLAVDASRTVKQLGPVIDGLRAKGDHRVAFMGRATGLDGFEDRVVGWPVVSVLIDRPPISSYWVRLQKGGVEVLEPANRSSACLCRHCGP